MDQLLYHLKLSPSQFVIVAVLIVTSHRILQRNRQATKADNKPYSRFGQPNAFFADKVLSFVIWKQFQILLLDIISVKTVRFQRNVITMAEKFVHHLACRLLNKSCGEDTLVGGTIRVPRNPNILYEWGILQGDGSNLSVHSDDSGKVDIEITCPYSTEKGKFDKQDGNVGTTYPKKMHGYRRSLDCDLQDLNLSPSVPILIWFHGGAMCLGSSRDLGVSVKLAQDLMEFEAKQRSKDGCKSKPLILLSVEYRLAPEHPFPAAIIDCLSTLSFIFKAFPRASIHVAGLSAGGNLASVVAFECMRKYPGRLKSATILHPYLLPQANTTSYNLNSNSNMISVNILRWCWRAYLSLDPDMKQDHSLSIPLIEQLFQEKSHFYRLCCPQIDIPSNISNTEEAPLFIVCTATADALQDDGLDLLKCIMGTKKSLPRNVIHLEGNGSHVLSLIFDKESKRKLINEWHIAIWGSP